MERESRREPGARCRVAWTARPAQPRRPAARSRRRPGLHNARRTRPDRRRPAGDPAECAARYEAQGADEIVLLDVATAPDERSTQLDTVRRVRAAIRVPLTVGGG